MSTIEQLTAALLRKQVQAEHKSRKPPAGERPDYVRRFLKRGAKEEKSLDTEALAPDPSGGLGDLAGVARSISRARMALLSKKPEETESGSLAALMGD